MRHLLAATALLGLLAAPAGAQDKAPIWTGLYVGAHAGYGWGEWDGEPIYDPGTGPFPIFEDQAAIDSEGWLGGGQIGFNKQFGALVVGVEVDGSWTDLDGDKTFVTIGDDYGWDVSTRLEAFGTARLRLGYAAGPFLFYGTGGVAYGRTEADETVTGGLVGANFPVPTVTVKKANAEQDHIGWAAGAGVEWALTPSWSVKGEWMHVDLGEAEYRFVGTAYPGTPGAAPHTTDSYNADLTFDVIRLGVNYKFGAP